MIASIKNISNKHIILLTGLIAYVVMLVYAVLFCRERMVMSDVAFQLFEILKGDNFAIQINRYGAAVTQAFPLLASKMHLSLKAVAMAYSISFIVYYFGVFLIVLLGLKNERMALVILLFNTILVRHSFFWIQCEFVQGAVFTLLYLAVVEKALQKEAIPFWFYVISPFFLVTIIYFYPMLLFIMLFGLAFFMLFYKKQLRMLTALMLLYVLLFVVKTKYLNNYYDAKSMTGVENIILKYPDYFQQKSFLFFYEWMFHDYYFLALFWLLALGFLLYTKKYLTGLLMSSFLIGVCFLININFADLADQFYLESQYLILMIFVGMPFSYLLLNHKKLRPYFMTFMLVSIFISLIRIPEIKKKYAQRIDYISEIVNLSPSKRIMKDSDLDGKILRFKWGFSFEAWLLSTMNTEKSVSIVYAEKEKQFDKLLLNSHLFITLMGTYDYDLLNPRYFKFDTLTYYTYY